MLIQGKWVISDTREGLVKLWYDQVTRTYYPNKTVPFFGGKSTEPFQAATLEEATALFVLLVSKATYPGWQPKEPALTRGAS